MKEHPQAELLRAIADGKQMQVMCGGEWLDDDYESSTAFHLMSSRQPGRVRIKPATILVNGIEVPEPMRVAPANGTVYWAVDFTEDAFCHQYTWRNDDVDDAFLAIGICHTTEANAIAHAKAMLEPSMKGVK